MKLKENYAEYESVGKLMLFVELIQTVFMFELGFEEQFLLSWHMMKYYGFGKDYHFTVGET